MTSVSKNINTTKCLDLQATNLNMAAPLNLSKRLEMLVTNQQDTDISIEEREYFSVKVRLIRTEK